MPRDTTINEAAPSVTALSDQAPIALIALTREDCVRDTNPAAEDLLGLSRKRLSGRHLDSFLVNSEALLALCRHARSNATDTSTPDVTLKPKGLASDFRAAVRVRWFHSGELVLAISPLLSNVSEDAGAGVASFGRILGHEIKNPLAGISGAAQLLLRRAGPDQKELLGLICEEAGRIERLINRLSAFELFSTPQLEATNIHAVLDKVIAGERAAFDGKVEIVRRYDPSLPDIRGDADHLHEAFQNILRNAVEASLSNLAMRPPVIEVGTAFEAGFTRRPARKKRGYHRELRVDITDSGVGVDEADAKSLFDAFSSSKSAGRGLGLTVVKEVLTAHAGQVDLRNTGQGTRVSVFLPFTAAENG